MFEVLSYSDLLNAPTLRRNIHCDRMQQFHNRHGWGVSVTRDGLEIDQFDKEGTIYCVVRDGPSHQASLRLREARDGNMVEQAFGQFWNGHARALRGAVEVTRLVSSRESHGTFRQLSVAELLLGMCRHSRATDRPDLFGVIFPSVARALSRTGWAPEILDQMGKGRDKLLLARWTATAAVDWTLQETVACLTDRAEALEAEMQVGRAVA